MGGERGPPESLGMRLEVILTSSLISFTVGGKKKALRMGPAVPPSGGKSESLPPLLSKVNGTLHVSIM